MDTELARTFLIVVAAGNFINAAERLHVTQWTVSARIHSLEETLGCTLFRPEVGIGGTGTALCAASRAYAKIRWRGTPMSASNRSSNRRRADAVWSLDFWRS